MEGIALGMREAHPGWGTPPFLCTFLQLVPPTAAPRPHLSQDQGAQKDFAHSEPSARCWLTEGHPKKPLCAAGRATFPAPC